MDPNKLLRSIIEHVEGLAIPGVWSFMGPEQRAEAKAEYAAMCADLAEWLAKGGFLPNVAPLLARGERMAGHVGGGSIFDNRGYGSGPRYVFYAPLGYPVAGAPEWETWRFVVYDGRDKQTASYQFPKG